MNKIGRYNHLLNIEVKQKQKHLQKRPTFSKREKNKGK